MTLSLSPGGSDSSLRVPRARADIAEQSNAVARHCLPLQLIVALGGSAAAPSAFFLEFMAVIVYNSPVYGKAIVQW